MDMTIRFPILLLAMTMPMMPLLANGVLKPVIGMLLTTTLLLLQMINGKIKLLLQLIHGRI